MDPHFVTPDEAKQEVNVIPMNFCKDWKADPKNPGELKEVHRVDLVKRGTTGDSTPYTITQLKRNERLWAFVEPYYEHWLKGQEPPEEGTPLDVLSFLPPPLVGHLKNLHIRTAEDLAEATDSALERIGMGARGWREKARSYLESKNDISHVAAENAQLKTRNDQMQEEIDELRGQIAELMADRPKRRIKK